MICIRSLDRLVGLREIYGKLRLPFIDLVNDKNINKKLHSLSFNFSTSTQQKYDSLPTSIQEYYKCYW